jgi:hypothetical protein
MKLFIDTEFNKFGGDLISLALVDEVGREFYEVVDCPSPGAWVAQHVIPVLGKLPIQKHELSHRLAIFLAPYKAIHVIADWPDDIRFFCDALIVGPGTRINTPPLTMEILRDIGSEQSAVPHNALADAYAIRAAYRRRA